MNGYKFKDNVLHIMVDDKVHEFFYIDDIKPVLDGNSIFRKQFSYDELVSYQSKRYPKQLVNSLLEDEDHFNVDDLNDLSERLMFCKFALNTTLNKSGIYIWVVDEEIIYIGQTKYLAKRFKDGYGSISRRNIFKGGQSTNCKMNRLVLKLHSLNKTVKIYFKEISSKDEYLTLEKQLIEILKPFYNKQNNN